jgi:hypothetical protein
MTNQKKRQGRIAALCWLSALLPAVLSPLHAAEPVAAIAGDPTGSAC